MKQQFGCGNQEGSQSSTLRDRGAQQKTLKGQSALPAPARKRLAYMNKLKWLHCLPRLLELNDELLELLADHHLGRVDLRQLPIHQKLLQLVDSAQTLDAGVHVAGVPQIHQANWKNELCALHEAKISPPSLAERMRGAPGVPGESLAQV